MRAVIRFQPYADPHNRVLRSAVEQLLAHPQLSTLRLRVGEAVEAASVELDEQSVALLLNEWSQLVSFAALRWSVHAEALRQDQAVGDRPTQPSPPPHDDSAPSGAERNINASTERTCPL